MNVNLKVLSPEKELEIRGGMHEREITELEKELKDADERTAKWLRVSEEGWDKIKALKEKKKELEGKLNLKALKEGAVCRCGLGICRFKEKDSQIKRLEERLKQKDEDMMRCKELNYTNLKVEEALAALREGVDDFKKEITSADNNMNIEAVRTFAKYLCIKLDEKVLDLAKRLEQGDSVKSAPTDTRSPKTAIRGSVPNRVQSAKRIGSGGEVPKTLDDGPTLSESVTKGTPKPPDKFVYCIFCGKKAERAWKDGREEMFICKGCDKVERKGNIGKTYRHIGKSDKREGR